MGVGFSLFMAVNRGDKADTVPLCQENVQLTKPGRSKRRARRLCNLHYTTVVFMIWLFFSVGICVITEAPAYMAFPVILLGFCLHALVFYAMDSAQFLSRRGGVNCERLCFLALLLLLALLSIGLLSLKLKYSLWNLAYGTAIKKSISSGLFRLNVLEAEHVLKTATRILAENNVTAWASEGTALGIVREGRILPWDDDVDIGAWDYDRERIVALIPELDQAGLVMADEQGPYFLKFVYGTTILDVDITGAGHYCHAASSPCEDIMPFLSPLKKVTFEGEDILVPSTAYLRKVYGASWKFPIKNYKPACKGYSSNC